MARKKASETLQDALGSLPSVPVGQSIIDNLVAGVVALLRQKVGSLPVDSEAFQMAAQQILSQAFSPLVIQQLKDEVLKALPALLAAGSGPVSTDDVDLA